MPPTFTNPYREDTKSSNTDLRMTSVFISREDYDFIRSLRPTTGTTRTVISLLWQKLTTALKEHGITDYTSKADFESFVANCRIIDGRYDAGATPSPGRGDAGKPPRRRRKANEPNDGRGAESLSSGGEDQSS